MILEGIQSLPEILTQVSSYWQIMSIEPTFRFMQKSLSRRILWLFQAQDRPEGAVTTLVLLLVWAAVLSTLSASNPLPVWLTVAFAAFYGCLWWQALWFRPEGAGNAGWGSCWRGMLFGLILAGGAAWAGACVFGVLEFRRTSLLGLVLFAALMGCFLLATVRLVFGWQPVSLLALALSLGFPVLPALAYFSLSKIGQTWPSFIPIPLGLILALVLYLKLSRPVVAASRATRGRVVLFAAWLIVLAPAWGTAGWWTARWVRLQPTERLIVHRLAGQAEFAEGSVLSPDGKQVMAGVRDAVLMLWDVKSGREVRRFQELADRVKACAFSPNGKRVLSASSDKTIKLWDLGSGQEIRRFLGHTNYVGTCRFSADGKRVLSGSDDDSIRLWDVESGQELRRFTGHTKDVSAADFSPDEKRVLSGSSDKTIRLWDVETGKELHILQGHTDFVRAASFSPDGQFVLSASDDKTLRLWDARSGQEVRSLQGHRDAVRACTFSPDGRHLLSGSDDDTLKLWDTETGLCLSTWHLNAGVMALSWRADSPNLWPHRPHTNATQVVAAGLADGTILLLDLTDGLPAK